jgi:hypothetical protein
MPCFPRDGLDERQLSTGPKVSLYDDRGRNLFVDGFRYILSSVVASTLLVLAWTTVVTKLSISPWTIPFWVDITIFFTITIVWWCQVPLQLPPNELAHEIPLEGVSCCPEQAVDGTFPVRDLENGTS